MKNRNMLVVLGLVVLGLSGTYGCWNLSGLPVREFHLTGKKIDWNSDLDYVIKQAKLIAQQLPNHSPLCTDVVSECERMRLMFDDKFRRESQGEIDFILQIHPDTTGGLIPSRFSPNRSMQLMSEFLVAERYDFIVHEGSGFDGFSVDAQVKEILARVKYEQGSPLYKKLNEIGFDFGSSGKLHSFLSQMVLSNDFGGAKAWMELERRITTRFLAGESIPLSILAGRLMMGEIGGSDQLSADSMFVCVQRVRSAYALAKALDDLGVLGAKRGAVVYGFKHKDDFNNLALAIGLKGKIYNATGVSWRELE